VIFSLSEDYLPEIAAGLKAGGALQVTALDRANVNTLAVGRLNTLDNSIDTTTGMVKARAEFENKDNKLYPNQFVNVQLLVNVNKNVITMPSAAIQTGANGSFVYLVKADNKVAVQPIVVGVSDNSVVEVKSGVDEGDKVVIDGADRLRDGAEIRIAEGKQAPDAAAPDNASTPPKRARRDGDGAAPDKRDGDPEKARERRSRKRPDAE